MVYEPSQYRLVSMNLPRRFTTQSERSLTHASELCSPRTNLSRDLRSASTLGFHMFVFRHGIRLSSLNFNPNSATEVHIPAQWQTLCIVGGLLCNLLRLVSHIIFVVDLYSSSFLKSAQH